MHNLHVQVLFYIFLASKARGVNLNVDLWKRQGPSQIQQSLIEYLLAWMSPILVE